MRRTLLACLCNFLVALPGPMALPLAAAEQVESPRLDEVVVLVSDLAPLEAAFIDVLHWTVVFRGDLRYGEATGWGLPPGVRSRQLLLGSPGSGYGRIRFVQLGAARAARGSAAPMRPAPQWWDTGGAFAINLFVSDAQATLDGLRARGWTTQLPMQSYEERSGDRIVARGRFARMVGPDELVLSFQERQAPALDKWPAFAGASHVENVMEPVTALEDWTRVTTALIGVEPPPPTLRDVSARPQAAATYGLPAAAAPLARARQSILRIGRSGEQMLTGWQFETLRGIDHSSQIDADHLGVLALRVRIPDAAAAASRLHRAGVGPVAGSEQRRLRPYGAIRSIVVRSGGGSGLLLEAIELIGAQP